MAGKLLEQGMLEIALFCGAWFVAGVVNNLAGFGAAMVAMPLVAFAIPLEVAVPSSTLIVLTLNLQLGWAYRRHVDWLAMRFLIPGGIAGVAVGLLIMRDVSNEELKLAMGLLLIAYGLVSLLRPGSFQGSGVGRVWGLAAGFCSTLLGVLFGFNGPPLAVFTSMGGWSQQAAKGILGACFIVTGITIVTGQTLAGVQTARTLTYYAAGCPAVLLGGGVGILASRFVTQNVYRRLVLLLILAAGVAVTYSSI